MRTKDSELGMIRPEDAQAGLTHGVPGLAADGLHPAHLPLVPMADEPGWMRARVDVEAAMDLVRTPDFVTWQGACWLFHCGRPMVFVGEWKQGDLLARSDGSERGARAVLASVSLTPPAIEELYEELDHIGGVYTFRCGACGVLRGSYDFD